jgi:hypothetical protein
MCFRASRSRYLTPWRASGQLAASPLHDASPPHCISHCPALLTFTLQRAIVYHMQVQPDISKGPASAPPLSPAAATAAGSAGG